jgi:hypothetical protein
MANPTSRKIARDHFATLVENELVNTTPKIAMAVFNYKPTDFRDSGTPAVIVLSSGIMRPKAGAGSEQFRTEVRLETITFVPRGAKSGAWTADKAEDRLDELERRIAKVVAEYQRVVGKWTNLWFQESMSDIFPSTLGGEPYMSEVLTTFARLERGT